MFRRTFLLTILVGTLSGCAPYGGDLKKSDKQRLTASAAPSADVAQVVDDNTRAALDLYRRLVTGTDNAFLSPYSISSALAMTYAGMAGATATQTATAMHFTLPAARLHPAFNAIDLGLTQDSGKNGEQLVVDDEVWAQEGKKLMPAFLDTLAQSYGVGVRELDFQQDSAGAIKTINGWISYETNGLVPNLVGPAQVNASTTLVLTNAVYFKANWSTTFDKNASVTGSFNDLDGSKGSATFMNGIVSGSYAQANGVTVATLPYKGATMDFVVLMPDEGTFTTFESGLSAASLDTLVTRATATQLQIALPKMQLTNSYDLASALKDMGMTDAFLGGVADLSGMDGLHDLSISSVVHQSNLTVDEQGTEAAAATAVSITDSAAPVAPVTVKLDRPFIFALRHRATGTILFLGRYTHS